MPSCIHNTSQWTIEALLGFVSMWWISLLRSCSVKFRSRFVSKYVNSDFREEKPAQGRKNFPARRLGKFYVRGALFFWVVLEFFFFFFFVKGGGRRRTQVQGSMFERLNGHRTNSGEECDWTPVVIKWWRQNTGRINVPQIPSLRYSV